MKRALAILLACTMVLGLTACSGSKKWTGKDFIFNSGSEQVAVKKDHAFIVYEGISYLTQYSDGSYEEYASEYETNRGLKLGMTLNDYKKLYPVVKGYAVWELYSGSENEYTSFAEYNNQNPSDMYDDSNNVWLDIGFCKEGNNWRALKDFEIQNVWFCDAEYSEYEEAVVFAVNFDKWGQVVGISLEYFTYDESWTEWQGWPD